MRTGNPRRQLAQNYQWIGSQFSCERLTDINSDGTTGRNELVLGELLVCFLGATLDYDDTGSTNILTPFGCFLGAALDYDDGIDRDFSCGASGQSYVNYGGEQKH
jgi:hypothetical protein